MYIKWHHTPWWWFDDLIHIKMCRKVEKKNGDDEDKESANGEINQMPVPRKLHKLAYVDMRFNGFFPLAYGCNAFKCKSRWHSNEDAVIDWKCIYRLCEHHKSISSSVRYLLYFTFPRIYNAMGKVYVFAPCKLIWDTTNAISNQTLQIFLEIWPF